ncbi:MULTISPECIES: hypothetical protein [unclassified Aeromicrobium]|uniref:hypothetical protein n=1 Tax=unclassified Aeromicrobium TaxID=2633570 RepID=UPI00396AF495
MSLRRGSALAAVAALLAVLLGSAPPALADASVDAVLPQGDGTSVLVVAVDGGCGDASTTGLVLEMPEGVALVDATAPDGWTRLLEGSRVEFTGPGIPAGQVTEFLLTSRIGAEPGASVVLGVEQRCAGGGRGEASSAEFEATPESVDPRMTVRRPPSVSPGADGAQVALVVAVLVLAAASGTAVARRRSGRP